MVGFSFSFFCASTIRILSVYSSSPGVVLSFIPDNIEHLYELGVYPFSHALEESGETCVVLSS